MTLLSVLAATFGTLGVATTFVQVYKIFKRKSAKDISIINYSFLFVGATIWFLYGLELKNWAVILTNFTAATAVCLVIVGWIKYH